MSTRADSGVVAAQNQRPPFWRASVTSGNIASGTTTYAQGTLTGKRSGDFLVAVVALASTDTIATPTGWTAVDNQAVTSAQKGYLFTRVADGTATDAPTWTKTGTAATWGVQVACFGACAGLDVSTKNTGTSSGGGAMSNANVTPTIASGAILSIFWGQSVFASVATITHWKQELAASLITNVNMTWLTTKPRPASLYTAESFTGGSSKNFGCFTVALKHQA